MNEPQSQAPEAVAPIGIYVHHQGRGHAIRTQLLIQHLGRRCTVFTSVPEYFNEDCNAEVVALPLDYGEDNPYDQALSAAAPALHYAPLQQRGLQDRMALMAAWIQEHRPAVMLIDLSVEVALFCRLMSVPTIMVRIQGRRDDAAHLMAFQLARAILCPFPPNLELTRLPNALEKKCYYTGAYHRFPSTTSSAFAKTHPDLDVLVLLGSGGTDVSILQLSELAAQFPKRKFAVLGKENRHEQALAPNLYLHGNQADVAPWLAGAAIVIGSAGSTICYEVGAFRKPFICMPEERAFGEQASNAAGLARLGLAVVADSGWPAAQEWQSLISRAEALDPSAWANLFVDEHLEAVAAFIERIAAESPRSPDRFAVKRQTPLPQ